MLIDGYEDLVEVGRGASAVVYRARQTAFDRIVALKVLGTTALDDASRRRFDRECRALGTLGWHPRVVPVFDAGISASGHPYLVMEYLPEGSVADRLRSEGALDPSDVVAIGIQTGDALEAAHRIGVLHRDVKPGNLLVGHFGGIKLADFGIAAVTSANTSVTDALAGTLSFMAPEILQGKKATPSSDVYSLGSTLFTLLTATTAFSSPTDESPFAALMRVVNDPLPNLRDTGTPDEVAAVVEAAMAKDPADRYDSAAALVAALHQVASRYGWPEEATYADRPPVSTKPAPPGGAAENPTSVADASTVVRPSGAVAGATASLDGLDEPTVLRRDEPGPRRDADRIEPQPAPEPAPDAVDPVVEVPQEVTTADTEPGAEA